MSRSFRVIAITVGLIAAGAVFGAMAGAVALTTSLWFAGDPSYEMGLSAGAFFGAPMGAFTAPFVAFLFLRRVPLGQMFLWLTAGTVIGGVVGWITAFSSMDAKVVGGLAGAVIGCLVAAIRMRYHTNRLEA
ncbi:MAG TPA: hypothetical protein VK113_05450 [Gemmatimonadales bacterium]|nr:hypothetical protein [Gemmatimonadales bacterium]